VRNYADFEDFAVDGRLIGLWQSEPVLVGVIPEAVVLEKGDQVGVVSDAGNLRVEFDVNRCPFGSNVFQAPTGMRLLSGPAVVGARRDRINIACG